MRTSSVHPANYPDHSIEVSGDEDLSSQTHPINSTSRLPGARFIGLLLVILLLVIAVITIPVLLKRSCETNQNERHSTSTMNNSHSFVTTDRTEDPLNFTKSPALEGTDETDIQKSDGSTSMTSSVTTVHSSALDVISSTSTDHARLHSLHSINTTESTPATLTATMTERSLIFLNHPGDFVVGLYNTTTGQPAGGFDDLNSEKSEEQPSSIMDNSTGTKYFNYGCKANSTVSYSCGLGTGFLVVSFNGSQTVARALLYATADDEPKRDPMNFTLEGSNVTDQTVLRYGVSWSLIYQGPTGINNELTGRQVYGIQQNFSNEIPYTTYRVLITSVRGPDANGVQYSEARIIGYKWF